MCASKERTNFSNKHSVSAFAHGHRDAVAPFLLGCFRENLISPQHSEVLVSLCVRVRVDGLLGLSSDLDCLEHEEVVVAVYYINTTCKGDLLHDREPDIVTRTVLL